MLLQVLFRITPRLIGLLFLWAGTYKIFFPSEAVLGLEALDLPRWVAEPVVYLVIVMELYLGLLLFLKIDLHFAMRLAFGLLFAFTAYLFCLSTLANPPSCGCLGLTGIFKSSKHQAIFDLFRNVVLLWALVLSYRYYFPAVQRQSRQPARTTVPANT